MLRNRSHNLGKYLTGWFDPLMGAFMRVSFLHSGGDNILFFLARELLGLLARVPGADLSGFPWDWIFFFLWSLGVYS